MAKTLMSILTVLSIVFCCRGSEPVSSAGTAIHIGPESTSASRAKSVVVEVKFEGLMVFHKEIGDRYEVGILSSEVAPGHTFEIEVDGKKQKLSHTLKPAEKWILEVRDSSGRPTSAGGGTTLRHRGHSGGRLKDSRIGQWDFDWAVDLEKEFHHSALELKPGYLMPIIHLPYGELYTKYKSPMVQRKQGKEGKWYDFGFVTETTALGVKLDTGEELVLRVADTSPEVVIFRRSFGSIKNVAIRNAPMLYRRSELRRRSRPSHKGAIHNPPDEPSHFTMYYNLFTGVSDDKRYDFRLRVPPKHPFNEWPGPKHQTKYEHEFWIGSMPCGKVLLGLRPADKPLE